MPTMTNEQVLAALTALDAISVETLRPRAAVRIAKVRRELAQHWADLQPARQAILTRHALLNDRGEPVMRRPEGAPETMPGEIMWISAEHQVQGEAEHAELMADTFEAQRTISLDDLGDIEMSWQTAYNLGPVLVDPEETTPPAEA